MVFKALSVLYLRIPRMSLFIEKHDSEFSEERETWPVVNRLCLFCSQTELKLFKKSLKFLTKADIPLSLSAKVSPKSSGEGRVTFLCLEVNVYFTLFSAETLAINSGKVKHEIRQAMYDLPHE